MQNWTMEEMVFLNAGANNGVQKGREDMIRNLKLTYAIGNDDIKEDVKPLIKKIENLSDAEYEELAAQIPFDTGVPEDVLHAEVIDTYEEE